MKRKKKSTYVIKKFTDYPDTNKVKNKMPPCKGCGKRLRMKGWKICRLCYNKRLKRALEKGLN